MVHASPTHLLFKAPPFTPMSCLVQNRSRARVVLIALVDVNADCTSEILRASNSSCRHDVCTGIVQQSAHVSRSSSIVRCHSSPFLFITTTAAHSHDCSPTHMQREGAMHDDVADIMTINGVRLASVNVSRPK